MRIPLAVLHCLDTGGIYAGAVCVHGGIISFFPPSLSLYRIVSAYTLDRLITHACPRSVIVAIRLECAHPYRESRILQ